MANPAEIRSCWLHIGNSGRLWLLAVNLHPCAWRPLHNVNEVTTGFEHSLDSRYLPAVKPGPGGLRSSNLQCWLRCNLPHWRWLNVVGLSCSRVPVNVWLFLWLLPFVSAQHVNLVPLLSSQAYCFYRFRILFYFNRNCSRPAVLWRWPLPAEHKPSQHLLCLTYTHTLRPKCVTYHRCDNFWQCQIKEK